MLNGGTLATYNSGGDSLPTAGSVAFGGTDADEFILDGGTRRTKSLKSMGKAGSFKVLALANFWLKMEFYPSLAEQLVPF